MGNPYDAWLQHPAIGIPPEAFHGARDANRKEARPASNKLRVPFTRTVSVEHSKKSFPYFEVLFLISAEVTGKAEFGGAGDESEGEGVENSLVTGYDYGAFALGAARNWLKKDGYRVLGLDTAFTEFEFNGKAKVGSKQVEVVFTAAGKLACGVELELEITLLSLKASSAKVTGPEAILKGKIPAFPITVQPMQGVKFSDLQIRPVLGLQVRPNEKKIAEEALKKLGEDSALETAEGMAEEAIGAELTLDGILIGGFFLLGTATIGAAIMSLCDTDELVKTKGQTKDLADKMTEGFRIGAAGGPAPGDKAMMAGYALGIKNYKAAYEAVKKKNPNGAPEAMRKAIAAQVPAAIARIAPQILLTARETVWEQYASSHQDSFFHGCESDRLLAYDNIFQELPRGCERYTKYFNKWTNKDLT